MPPRTKAATDVPDLNDEGTVTAEVKVPKGTYMAVLHGDDERIDQHDIYYLPDGVTEATDKRVAKVQGTVTLENVLTILAGKVRTDMSRIAKNSGELADGVAATRKPASKPAAAKKATPKAAPPAEAVNEAGFPDERPAVDPAVVREWALSKGMEVSQRGRMGSHIYDAYFKAHKPRVKKVASGPVKATAAKKAAGRPRKA